MSKKDLELVTEAEANKIAHAPKAWLEVVKRIPPGKALVIDSKKENLLGLRPAAIRNSVYRAVRRGDLPKSFCARNRYGNDGDNGLIVVVVNRAVAPEQPAQA